MDWFGLSGAKGVVNCGIGLLQATVFLPCCAIRCDRVHIYTASAVCIRLGACLNMFMCAYLACILYYAY